MLGRVAAAATGDVEQATRGKLTELARHVDWAEIEAGRGEWIRHARVGVTRDEGV